MLKHSTIKNSNIQTNIIDYLKVKKSKKESLYVF